MNKIYKYLENRQFVEWAFESNQNPEVWWETHEEVDHSEKEAIIQANKILQKLHTKDKELPEGEKIIMFIKILRSIEEQQRSRKTKKLLIDVLKYAAVALIFFAIGALVYRPINNFNHSRFTQGFSLPTESEDARLIRSDGERVTLSEKKSVIEHRKDGQVLINNNFLQAAKSNSNDVPVMNQLIIPYGKTSEVLLPDGTKVWLNAGSRLIYPEFFKDKVREVFLVGEAFFNVAGNDEKPFVVQTTDVKIRVLGTQFNISAYASEDIIETVLTEGRILLEHKTTGLFPEKKEIHPGQMATFSKADRAAIIREVNVENYILWKEGLLKFESTDLSRIIKRLERYFNIRFRYNDPFLGGIKISGKLGLDESRESVLDNIARAASIRITMTEEGYYEINQK